MNTKLLLVLLLSIFVIACEKEVSFEVPGYTPVTDTTGNNTDTTGNTTDTTGNNNPVTNAALIGIWNFKYLDGAGVVETVITASGISATSKLNLAYRTRENTGTMTFAANGIDASVDNLGYSVDTVATLKSYLGGALISEDQIPFVEPYSSTDESTTYKLIGADSIYFNASFIDIDMGGSVASNPGGMKYNISGNTLTFTFSMAADSTVTEMGTVSRTKQNFTSSIVLFK